MPQTFLAAAVQMTSGLDLDANLATAAGLVDQAAKRGASLVSLPELFNRLGDHDAMLAAAEEIPGPTSRFLSDLASRFGITLVGGSFCERGSIAAKCWNTCLVFGPDGRELARYRKLHLFDIHIPNSIQYEESRIFLPGAAVTTAATSAGQLGIGICYDLRFPELFRRLTDLGAQIVALPSAFALATGRDHWEVLLRARAIENQVFIVAPNQYGQHSPQFTTYGRSMIVDPWGTPLAVAPDGAGIIVAEIDLRRVDEVRRGLPALKHRRSPEVFE